MHRQANSKRYLSPLEPELEDTATHDWEVFLQIFPERSGRHRHQGGLVIFILEGEGSHDHRRRCATIGKPAT